MSTKYANEYQQLFDTVQIRPQYVGTIDRITDQINRGKAMYQQIERLTGVPWFFIGLLHYMEAGNDFTRHLHNGDPLSRKTVNVPAGRPAAPPANGKQYSFQESAIDAIKLKKLDQVTDWSVPNMLYLLESYNGFGYRNVGIYSPYLWSFSNHYTAGKYTSDGHYDPKAVSKQAGAAVILRRVMEKNNLLKSAAGVLGAILLLTAGIFF